MACSPLAFADPSHAAVAPEQRLRQPTRTALLQLWASAEALRPVQFAWLKGRNAEIQDITARLLQKEAWKQPTSSTQHFPETPIELGRLCAAAVNAIIEMDVPTSGTVIRTQLEVVCGLALQFCDKVLHGCEDPSKLIRPSPPLTRFKDKLFQKILAGAAVKSGCAAQSMRAVHARSACVLCTHSFGLLVRTSIQHMCCVTVGVASHIKAVLPFGPHEFLGMDRLW